MRQSIRVRLTLTFIFTSVLYKVHTSVDRECEKLRSLLCSILQGKNVIFCDVRAILILNLRFEHIRSPLFFTGKEGYICAEFGQKYLRYFKCNCINIQPKSLHIPVHIFISDIIR